MDWDDVDRAVADGTEDAFALLERLVAQPSTVGNEAGAQEVLADALADLGFTLTRLPIPDDIVDHPAAGLPQRPYTDRYDLIGQRGEATGPSLVVNGHIDVVPAEDTSRWSHPPFQPVRADGWLYGRGSGDMKAGFAAGVLALRALDTAAPGWLTGRLTVVSAIEEECTGNGTLAAGLAGYTADAALLLEPTDLDVLLGGVGIIWVDIEVEGRAAHAYVAASVVNPVLAAQPVLTALRDFERQLNADHTDPAFAALDHPYTVNVGTFHSGDWASSVPAVAGLGVRIGHPRSWTADDALARVRDVVDKACAADPWLAEHPPTVRLSGYRVQGHALPADAPLAGQVAAAHRHAHDTEPARITLGSTTDARYYLNQFDMPAVAYGPRTRNIHGTDEAVELASIVATARTVTRFLVGYFR
ncbi:MAG TPA: ArgE/DapE family deacylase [Pseudonocardiaceae bacterium]